jgi:hypothetical protein
VAFLTGIAGVAGTFWAMDRYGPPSTEEVRADRVRAGEAALAGDRFDGAGEDNVRAITDQMLAERPNDPDALRLRRSASQHLAEDARTLAAQGERARALDTMRRALALAPEDEALRRAVAELEQPPGPTEASLAVSPSPVAGEPVILTAIMPAGVRFTATDRPRFVVKRDGRRVGRLTDATQGADEHTWIASYVFAAAGRHEVQFHGGEGDDSLRVSVEVDVERAVRTPSPGGDPPVTTQGSLGPSVGPVPTVVDVPILGPVPIPAPFVATPVQEPERVAAMPAQQPALQPIAPASPPPPMPLPPAWNSSSQ